MVRIISTFAALTAVGAVLIGSPAAAEKQAGPFPQVIQLPTGFRALTPDAAYFTDSQKNVLYRVPIGPSGALGDAQTITLGGDYAHVAGSFNLNGIDATPSGLTLVAVQSVNGRLYRIDASTGVAKLIALGAESVPNGDGILLTGATLYVVQNQLNRVAVIALEGGLRLWTGRHAAERSRLLGADDDRRSGEAPLRGERTLRCAEPGDRGIPGRATEKAEGSLDGPLRP